MAWILRRVVRTGLRRGLFEGSRAWLVAGVTVGGFKLLKRVFGEAPETVYEAEIKPGHGIEVRTVRRG